MRACLSCEATFLAQAYHGIRVALRSIPQNWQALDAKYMASRFRVAKLVVGSMLTVLNRVYAHCPVGESGISICWVCRRMKEGLLSSISLASKSLLSRGWLKLGVLLADHRSLLCSWSRPATSATFSIALFA